jgi:hypothetical protein
MQPATTLTRILTVVVLACAGPAALAQAAKPAPPAKPAAASKAAATPPGKLVSCPPQLAVHYQKVTRHSPDGVDSVISDFTPQFEVHTPVRLVGVQLAAAHGGSTSPSETLNPDELNFVPGRPARWSLWNGRPPEPTEEIFVQCDYEGGLRLQQSLGSGVHGCQLASAAQKPGPKDVTTRTILARAVFTCR